MDKLSNYNMAFEHQDKILMFNTFSDSLVALTHDEFEIIKSELNDLESFNKDYPKLYKEMKNAGFIIDTDFDELAYFKLMNNVCIYGNLGTHLTINPTLDCNLKCWYCSTEYAKAVHNGGMSDKTVNAIKKHIEHLISDTTVQRNFPIEPTDHHRSFSSDVLV